jgi:uncharacterized protein (DUF1501 family)
MGKTMAMAPMLAAEPRFLLAQTVQPAAGKNVIVINMYGGVDGLTMLPYYSGKLVDSNRKLRPLLSVSPEKTLPFFHQANPANSIGFHPAFASLLAQARDHIAIIQNYGILGNPGRSHNTCQVLMSLGSSQVTEKGESRGFLARVMDLKDWDSMQYWAFQAENFTDTNTLKRKPLNLSSGLDDVMLSKTWLESDKDAQLNWERSQQLLELTVPNDELEQSQIVTVGGINKLLAVVRNDITRQEVGKNSAGDYDTSSNFGRIIRDTAKLLKAKNRVESLGLREKDSLVYIGQGGYDTHSDQNNTKAQFNLPKLFSDLSNNLAIFYQDLLVNGILDNTTVVLYSEFGRTTRENSKQGGGRAGTDHGHGNNTIVFGGSVKPGVIGVPPKPSDLSAGYNALVPKIDYRNVFGDVFEWLQIDPLLIFPEGYSRERLGLFL